MAIEAFLGTRPQKAFLFTIVATAVVVLAMVGIVYGKVNANFSEKDIPRTIPCYLALFAFAAVFETVITLDALKLRNTIQLIGILLFHCGMIVMSALQIPESRQVLETNGSVSCSDDYAHCTGPDSLFAFIEKFLIVIPIVLAFSLGILIWVTRSLFLEFGWAVFHAIGADPRMKVMYQYYQIMICFLKFDFFCFTGVTMQLLILVLQTKTAEFAVTIIAIPIVLVLLIVCGLALKREWFALMICSLALMAAAESYFIFKIVRVYEPVTKGQYTGIKGSVTIFLVVAALLLALTFIVGVRCFRDFGRGLRESKMRDPEKRRAGKATTGAAGTPGVTEQGSYNNGTVHRTFSIE